MASPRIQARVDDCGRIVPAHPERTLRRAGLEVWVSIHEKPLGAIGLRSDRANAYLWAGVYGEISRRTGNDPDSIHYGLKRKALEVGILEPQYIALGDKLIEDEPTTRTDSDTFTRYVEWIRHEAEHGDLTGIAFHIPTPEEYLESRGK
jgi:hypothetical protein